jgi:LPXTG-site transpeptidase (sortase) family protein
MRQALRISGTVLIAISVLGLAALGFTLLTPENAAPSATVSSAGISVPWAGGMSPSVGAGAARVQHQPSSDLRKPATDVRQADQPSNAAVSAAANAAFRPITRVVITTIGLSVEVVPAELVAVQRGLTWQVPAFKAGHAEGTAGAGQAGNAVLLGHVTSLHSGNVFQELDRVREGDVVRVFFGATDGFTYRVVATTHVPRTDSDTVQPTTVPSVSLITCTGTWLPTIWDYTERLVVRAELSQ